MRFCVSCFAFLVCLALVNRAGAKRVPKALRGAFSNCYSGNNTGIAATLSIKGYYCLAKFDPWTSGYGHALRSGDSNFYHVAFYSTGICVAGFQSARLRDASGYLDTVNRDSYQRELFYAGRYLGCKWGLYRINGDTITAELIFRLHSGRRSWTVWEERFVIVDSTTIRLLPGRKMLFPRGYGKPSPEKFALGTFVPYRDMPVPDAWINSEDWLRCDK